MKLKDEKELWSRWKKDGDGAAREQLILSHLGIVKYIAGRMAIHLPPTIDFEDLISWGVLGLLDAVDKFDHRQNTKFSAYAAIRIRGAILDEIRSLDWAPRTLRSLARKIGASRERLRHQMSREPTSEEIAAQLGIPAAEVEDALSQLQIAQVLALDDYVPEDEAGKKRQLDVTVDETIATPGDLAQQQEKEERLVQAILQLPEQQQKVLHLYYYEKLTLKEIGAVLEVTESRVSQIHTAAMRTLRGMVRGGA